MRHITDTAFLLIGASALGFVASCASTESADAGREESGGHYVRQSGGAADVVVFIHGIFGDQSGTWRHENGHDWPTLFAGDEQMATLDVYSVDYHTPFRGRAGDIDEIATRLRDQLERRGLFRYKSIHVVAHSMGGLITKALLLDLNTPARVDTLRQFKTISLLATPALGAPIADLGDWLSNNPQLGNMSPSEFNTFLERLERQWHGLLRERDASDARWPLVYCAYEKQAVAGRVLVVPRLYTSSRCDDDAYPMETATHVSIAKPAGIESDQYTWVRNHILASEVLSRRAKAGDRLRQERLLEVARDSPDPLERRRALEALFPPSTAGSSTPLELTDDPTMSVFRMGEKALFGSKEEVRVLRESVGALVLIMNDPGKPLRLRDETAHTLAKIGGDEAAAALLAVLAASGSPDDVRTTALHGPTRFWPPGPALDEFNELARLIIHSWPASACRHVTTNLKFKYLEGAIADSVRLCAEVNGEGDSDSPIQ